MTILNEKVAQTVNNDELSLGEYFRVTREKLQLSLDDVSKQLNLRPAILQLLENNELTHKSIPATFMKGYVRSYAKFLRIPEEIWTVAITSLEENTQHDLGKNARSTKAVNQYSSHGRWIGYVTILVLLIAAGMTALWWWENYQKSTQERDTFVQNYVENTPTNVVDTQAETAVENTLVAPVDNSPITSSSESNFVETQQNIVNEEAVVEKTTTPSAVVKEQSAVQNSQDIVVTKNAETESLATNSEAVVAGDLQIEIIGPNCWISVKDAKRKVLAQKEYKQGEILTFNAEAPYSLIIGAPNNVKITYKGEPYPLKIDGRVAKFKLQ
ncbi:transcriptional regulator with an N-terminal xre-type HTH domain [Canicola haemoglobinophilus]|uniref:Transcriptional regulator with an N-terminal xre-type HTH domain n=1 Tax=Canicola haemoglobinophilus TaxID=733 RepID=A0AB38H9K3_9PAST|nr:RodZ family helix-turn-helix domain-containing protein [Canicola haemoglobinophilus]STO54502.1 transcriptional regulator with an N-terminal xre-type HTH domain [Canicola haemoglobinophilus]STO69036.1 transcriptional regulator with an N-terminal xre-type HTH domain [Canicola haemoglobinophilus]